jgi:tetratricopeptide (TPR) repeat protein
VVAYRDALGKVKSAYPDDADVAALYAEAALYAAAGDRPGDMDTWATPKLNAYVGQFAALLPMFQASLAKFPNNPGLLHFYIHTAQFAKDSKVAVNAAKTLASFNLPAEDSHLTHMPGHTFFDVGMYDEGLDVGTRSVAMDYANIDCCHPGYYSAPRYYHSHNVEFLIYAMIQTGHAADTVAVARRANDSSLLERALVAAQDWQGVVDLPYAKGADGATTFARALAFAKLGQNAKAKAALSDLPAVSDSRPERAALVMSMRSSVLAQIALNNNNDRKALDLLETASTEAARGNRLAGYSEIPNLYYYSPNLALAALATKMNNIDVARAALNVELQASPKSPAALQALAKLNG